MLQSHPRAKDTAQNDQYIMTIKAAQRTLSASIPSFQQAQDNSQARDKPNRSYFVVRCAVQQEPILAWHLLKRNKQIACDSPAESLKRLLRSWAFQQAGNIKLKYWSESRDIMRQDNIKENIRLLGVFF